MDNESQKSNAMQSKQIQNNVNNAQNVRTAANVAASSGNPYAMAVGKGIQAADKLTGGKASEAIGKATTKALNNSGLKGKALQHALNKANESGTSERIGKAMAAKNGKAGPSTSAPGKNSGQNSTDGKTKGKGKIGGMGQNGSSMSEKKHDISDQASDGGGSIKVTFKAVKIALLVFGSAFLPLMIFMILIVSATMVISNTIGLGNADSIGTPDAEEKILDKMDSDSEDLGNEVTDEAYIYDIYIDDEYIYQPSKLVLIAKEKTIYEDMIDELEDFYSGINNYTEQYNKDDVYIFFLKLYDIRNYYIKNYNVKLDMSLLYATLNIQSDDKALIFSSNTVNYDRKNDSYFSYDYDWSNYNTNKKNSSHDIEMLAQHMVSRQSTETCVDASGKANQKNILRDEEVGNPTLECAEGETYVATTPKYSIDDEKYKEYLKEFLEKKYYLNESIPACLDGESATAFTQYDLNGDQLELLSAIAAKEQGTPKGAAAEASLMANLFEKNGKSFGVGGNGLYNYVINSGWWGSNLTNVDRKKASAEVIEAVRSVLIQGKRTLPGYVDEHDCIVCYKDGSGDIKSVKNDGTSIDIKDKTKYVQHVSEIENKYGAKYKFYSFPDEGSDPFGYTSDELREKLGEFHYDFGSDSASQCIAGTSSGMADAFVNLAVDQLNDPSRYGGKKYWEYMGFNYKVYWCACFVSWVIYNTSYNGEQLKDIINFKSTTVTTFANWFYEQPNLNFYYNDNCSKYKGKNNTSSPYMPKRGDIIFFNFNLAWSGVMPIHYENSGLGHIGIIQEVKDGKIKTIEGNASDSVMERFFELDSCQVAAFGSWY